MFVHWGTALGLLVYYSTIIVASAATWLYFAFDADDLPQEVGLQRALILAAAASAAFGSAFYVRKLYKDLFAQKAAGSNAEGAILATAAYFLFRPIFSILIGVLLTLGVYGFIHGVTMPGTHLGAGFVIFITMATALSAAITGHAIARLESLAEEAVQWLRTPG